MTDYLNNLQLFNQHNASVKEMPWVLHASLEKEPASHPVVRGEYIYFLNH